MVHDWLNHITWECQTITNQVATSGCQGIHTRKRAYSYLIPALIFKGRNINFIAYHILFHLFWLTHPPEIQPRIRALLQINLPVKDNYLRNSTFSSYNTGKNSG